MVHEIKNGEIVFLHGRVLNAATKDPVPGALVDIWQASTNGLYEQQDNGQVDHNLRGVFETDEQGRYSLYCLRPTPYPIPDDGSYLPIVKLRHDDFALLINPIASDLQMVLNIIYETD